MKVAALAGGTGGAKLLAGLQEAVTEPAAIVNTADDDVLYGVHVSPDVDMTLYRLSGLLDEARGWGIKGDTFHVVDRLLSLGHDGWFSLGDRDLATCMLRTEMLAAGASLTEATERLRDALGVRARVLPMTDEPVRTMVRTRDGRTLTFQEYFVRERHRPEIANVTFDGIRSAKPTPQVLEALNDADAVIICPSNPVVSIGPILELHEVRSTLHRHERVIAVSPLVGGRALKGPAEGMMKAAGLEVSVRGVAKCYEGLIDVLVIDEADAAEASSLRSAGMEVLVTNTIMRDEETAVALARAIL